ncbi:cache domain-containing protein [Methanosalsum natronophilum]|uniref:cache domain-containing protein n=1 Tax=Methanosalsum natronophilum TaxID=768733 RepID=UPI00216A5068|nr:cache domain-containing protein [Methanosalsum natronophilum]MCS3924396.1 PAS domain S-box-containing protein [Methanosalsum natronophilum]
MNNRLLVVFSAIFLILIFSLTAVSVYFQNNIVDSQLSDISHNMEANIDNRMEAQLDKAEMLLITISENEEYQYLFAEREREKLYYKLYQINRQLKDRGVSQFQFHLPNSTSFLRLHMPDTYGDDLSSFRETVNRANSDLTTTSGLEEGRGGLGFRVVTPIFYENEHIGSVEIGQNFDQIFLNNLKKDFGGEYFIYIFEPEKTVSWLDSPNTEYLASTIEKDPLPISENELAKLKEMNTLHYQHHNELVILVPFTDYSDQPLGYVKAIIPITEINDYLTTSIISTLILSSIILLLSLFVALVLSTTITKKFNIEKELKQSKNLKDGIFEVIQDAVCIIESDMTIKDVNKVMEKWYSSKMPLIGRKWHEIFQTYEEKSNECSGIKAFETKQMCSDIVPIRCVDANVEWIELLAYPIIDEDDKVTKVAIFLRDITQRKKIEEYDRSQTIIKEIHHRVKNNLQVIASLLNMQSRLFKHDKKVQNAFEDSQRRIISMSLAHEKLYSTENVASIEISDYVESLVSNISQMYNNIDKKIKTETVVTKNYLDMDKTIPIGLIINEIITNSYKHAFTGKDSGKIKISFVQVDDAYELVVQDDGIGIPDNLDYDNMKSLGLTVINLLVKQLNGKIEMDRSNGTTYTIVIPK